MKRYLIRLVCIDDGNSFGLEYNDVVYAAGFAGSDYTHDINDAFISSDIEYVKYIAKNILDNGDFMPSIHEVILDFGPSINF